MTRPAPGRDASKRFFEALKTRSPQRFYLENDAMKDKEKSKDKNSEKEAAKGKKHHAPSKRQKAVSKRLPKVVDEDDPEIESKLEEPDDDEPIEIEPDDDAELEPDDLEDIVEEEEIVIPPPPGKGAKSRRSGRHAAEGAGKNGADPAKPQTRLGLIRTRHESMKREIDQIREDLDAEEED